MNEKIKKALSKEKIKQYELANAMGISEWTLSRKMRYPLSDIEENAILRLIDEMAKGGEQDE